ncbi:MAG: hypothetical protein HZB14_09750 [Actinobacteria bacterium]|nr:hypothetical protein [Actinomycetota bacterium]
MRSDARFRVLAIAGVVDAAILLASLWMRWSEVSFDSSLGMFDSIKLDVTGWEVHDVLDIVIAVAAGTAILVNVAAVIGNARSTGGLPSLLSGAVAAGAVIWTMVDPPVPEFFDLFNSIPNVPDLKFEPAYGLFVALVAAIGLVLTGILQMGSGETGEIPSIASAPTPPPAPPAAPTPSTPASSLFSSSAPTEHPPDPFAKSPPPAPSPPSPPDDDSDEPFIDPVTGEPTDR